MEFSLFDKRKISFGFEKQITLFIITQISNYRFTVKLNIGLSKITCHFCIEEKERQFLKNGIEIL